MGSHTTTHCQFLTPYPRQPQRPLLIFLPGLDGTGELLQVQLQGLGQICDICCLAIPEQDRSDWASLAAQVVALIQQEQTQPPRPVVLCGESFGACLALEIACQYTQTIQQLVLLNPASSFGRRPWISCSPHVVRWLPEPFYRQSTHWLLPWLAATERISEPDQRALLAAMQQVSQSTCLWRLQLLSEFQVDIKTLSTLTLDVLLIAGTADCLLPSVAEIQRLQVYLPEAKLVTLANSGHACLLEQQVNLAALLQEHCPLFGAQPHSPKSYPP
jgi:pimeloyl-ACP methyl ester carboxylesterase